MAFSDKDIAFLDKLKSRGYSASEQTKMLNEARAKKGLPPVEGDVKGTIANLGIGFTKGVAGTGLLAGQISRLAPGDQSADPNSFFNRYKEAYSQTFTPKTGIADQQGFDVESGASQFGELAGGIAITAPLSMGTSSLLNLGLKGVATKAPGFASKVSPFVSLAEKKTLPNLAKFGAFEGAKDTAIYDLATKGETSASSIATGALTGGLLVPGLYGVTKGLSKLPKGGLPKNVAYNVRQKAPVRIVENNLNFTPTQVEKFKSNFKVSPGEYLLQNNHAGKEKTELLDLFNNKFSNAYTKKTEMLKPITQRFRNAEVDEMLQKIEKNVMENADDLARADLEGYLQKINSLKSSGTYSLNDTVTILREFDNWLKIYDAKGFVKGTGANKSLARLRDRVNDFVTKEAKRYGGVDLKGINNDIRISKSFQDGLFKSIIKDDKNNLLGLNDLLLGNMLSGGDPFTGLAVTLAKKGLMSKISSTGPSLAQKLYKYYGQPTSGTALTRSASGISDSSRFAPSVRSMGGTPVEALPPPSGKPLTTGKVIDVKPQIGYSKVNPPEITARSKIVRPGTYTENIPDQTPVKPVQKIAKKQETPKIPVKTTGGKTLDVLSKEARKYDTLEDFVKAVKKDILDDGPLSKVINDYKKSGGEDVVLKDFYLNANKTPNSKRALPMSQKSDVVYSKPVESVNGVRNLLKESGLEQYSNEGVGKLGQGRVTGEFSVRDEVITTKSRLGKGYKIKTKSTPTGNIVIDGGNGMPLSENALSKIKTTLDDNGVKYVVENGTIKIKSGSKSALPMSSRTPVKYSKVDDLASVITKPQESRFIKKPVVIKKDVWRGVTDEQYVGKGMAIYGNGLYTTTNKSIAKVYAGKNGKLLEISKTQLPEKALHFDTKMDYENWLDYEVQRKLGIKPSEFNTKYPDIGEFIKSLGHDGIIIGKGEIMVTYP